MEEWADKPRPLLQNSLTLCVHYGCLFQNDASEDFFFLLIRERSGTHELLTSESVPNPCNESSFGSLEKF